MKKFLNKPENFVDEMIEGIIAAHPDQLSYVENDLRCIVKAGEKKQGKVGLATGGGSGHRRRNVWEMQADGSYIAREETAGKAARSSQETFIELAQKRMSAASKHQQAKLRQKLLYHFHKRLQKGA